MNKIEKDFVKERYQLRFKASTFNKALKEYNELSAFAPNGNVFEDAEGISSEAHYIMRLKTAYHLKMAMQAMKIDLEDDNVAEDINNGNIGTYGRVAKVWCGFDVGDETELGSGRWSKCPRIAGFPNTDKTNKQIPITKRVDIISNCSHHLIPFHTLAREDSYAIISYIPDGQVLGISKLQRVADWVSQRFFLQEDLTRMLYDEISKVAQTDSVYVGLYNISHGCEMLRGSKSNDGAFTSEYYGGAFEDAEIRKSIKQY